MTVSELTTSPTIRGFPSGWHNLISRKHVNEPLLTTPPPILLFKDSENCDQPKFKFLSLALLF